MRHRSRYQIGGNFLAPIFPGSLGVGIEAMNIDFEDQQEYSFLLLSPRFHPFQIALIYIPQNVNSIIQANDV